MTKIEELRQIDAELTLLERDLARDAEMLESIVARIAKNQHKSEHLVSRLEAIKQSRWE